ncbi:D-serine/D-alanine/glycine transporter [Klebsiella pneumoniae]|nr:D-serine/D-alanine/glycine transporter [Klebsiella pneumoniae]
MTEHQHQASPAAGGEGASQLKRGLSARHIQMIALGGAIGTGLFMGAGRNIAVAGTSILVIYVLVGFFTYMVMRAMGELLLTRHDYRSFADFVGEYLGPQASFYLGWTYWLSWVVTCIADVVVCGSYMQYWFPELSAWMPALSMLAILFLLNLLSVKMFGEAEFWFALIKVITIIALIGTGGWMIATGWTSPDGVTASLSHLTDPTAFMPHGITGFFAGFQIAIFSFTGIELLGTMTAETRDPQRILPKAINALPLRIIIFYLLSMVVIIAVASWPGVSAETSPFVTLFAKAGLPAAAAVINFVALTSAMSSANSGGLLQHPHAVRPVGGEACALAVSYPVAQYPHSGAQPAVLLLLHADRHAVAVSGAERDDPVHHRLDPGGDYGGVQLGDDPRGLSGLPPSASGPARRVDL